MEGNYGVYFGNQLAGKVQVIRQGLYYRFTCRCQLTGDVICRLQVSCGDAQVSLGVVVPVDGGFGLDTKLPVKRLGQGEMHFTLRPKHEVAAGSFFPIYPEEPFSYIERLKKGFLARRGDQVGLLIRE